MTDYCTRYQDDLKAYADGELSPLRCAAVRRHLTHCASCQKEIAAMTQITDDLRSSEPADALPPSLREKLLAEPTQAQVPTLPKREGEELQGGSPLQTPRPPVSGGPLRSKEVGSRRIPAWTFAAVVLVAWFAFYPLYQKTRQQTATTTAISSVAVPIAAHPPVRVAQEESAALDNSNALEHPSPALMHPDIPEPKRAKAPPPPPMMASAPSVPLPLGVPLPPEKAVARAYDMHTLRPVPPVAGNGSATSDTLNGDPDTQRQVHKEASIGVQVANPESAGDKINQMVQDTGGYVAANNLSTDPDGMKSGELIVKVPEPQFETFLAQVAKLGVVVSKNVTGQDITEKTSDAHEAQDVEESDLTQAEARLKLLGSHAKWDDTQNAEDLRVQLAQTRARLKLLKRMAALGTLTIDLSQTPKAAAAAPVTNGFTGTLKATTHDALQSLVGSAAALLALVIWLLAYSPIWVPLLLIGRYCLKEYRKRDALTTHTD